MVFRCTTAIVASVVAAMSAMGRSKRFGASEAFGRMRN